MIETINVSKKFDKLTAVDRLSLKIDDGSIFGLTGTNGAGKSTLLRMMAGILRADEGEILVDAQSVFENKAAKEKVFFISDDVYYFPNATPADMAVFYESYYPAFDRKAFSELISGFGLEENRKLRGFSKGMKKQFAVAAGLAAGTKYLLCDETFDGLDPVMRQGVKRLFASAMADRGLSVVLASHSLRELEDICDHVGILHRGGILLSRELEDAKECLNKVQIVYREDAEAAGASLPDGLKLLKQEQKGRLHSMILRGDSSLADAYFKATEPVYYERIPLSLEEIFIAETEEAGYDIKELLA